MVLLTLSVSDPELADQDAEGRGGVWAESTEPGVLIKAQFGIQIQKFPRFQVWGVQVRGMWGRGKQSQRASQGNEKCHPSTGSGL